MSYNKLFQFGAIISLTSDDIEEGRLQKSTSWHEIARSA